ncbi:DUF397 domain-containing protein [Streptomyces sp. G45]|uniref:DUF397 domain-containing protein n=1 Tax=Streptomyces sp. G45 TaxID=3406627 RepID=UPI003C1E3895
MDMPLNVPAEAWRKSSYSDGVPNNCLEVADLTAYPAGGVGIRDSKDPDGPALHLSHPAWKAFLTSLTPEALS